MKTEDKNTIGKLIIGPAFRDAVHVAVAPCMAVEGFRTAEPTTTPGNESSKMYLQIYAEQHKMKLEDLLSGVEKYVTKGCDDPVFEDDFNQYEVPLDFWTHYQAFTGHASSGNFWGCCI